MMHHTLNRRPHPLKALATGAAMLALGFAGAASHAAAFDSFEDFTGNSGDPINGFDGDNNSGTWSSGQSNSMVIVDDGTAYDGHNYWRIDGVAQGGQVLTTKTLTNPVDIADGGTFSFMLRRTDLHNAADGENNAGLIFDLYMTDDSTDQTLGQVFNRGMADHELDVWYRHDLTFTVDGDSVTIGWSVTNTETEASLFNNTSHTTRSLNSVDHTQIDGFRMFTWSTQHYVLDVDDLAIVPEPASLALLSLGGLMLAGRRRRG